MSKSTALPRKVELRNELLLALLTSPGLHTLEDLHQRVYGQPLGDDPRKLFKVIEGLLLNIRRGDYAQEMRIVIGVEIGT